MKRTAPDGNTMDYYQTASGRESFTMDNVNLGFEIDSMSNLGASFGVTRYGLRHNGYPTKKYVGGIHCAGFQYGNFTSSLKQPGVLRSSNFCLWKKWFDFVDIRLLVHYQHVFGEVEVLHVLEVSFVKLFYFHNT